MRELPDHALWDSDVPSPFDAVGCSTPQMQFITEARETLQREIAQELHDTVIQPLTALVMGLSMQPSSSPADTSVSSSSVWYELAQEALDALRATLAGLRTHPHASLGLPGAIRQYLIPQCQRRRLEIRLESVDWPVDVPIDCASSLYLMVREAVTNAEKHGHASQVSIRLQADAQYLVIIVRDNGVGFAPNGGEGMRITQPGSGLGLRGMNERVRRLGGDLQLTAAPRSGAQVEVRIPVGDIRPATQVRTGHHTRGEVTWHG